MRLTLVISSLSAGGAERVMSAMANELSKAGHDVTVVTLDGEETDYFKLHPDVQRIALGMLAPSASLYESARTNALRVFRLRKRIRATDPDVVVSFIDKMNILTLLAALVSGIPVVVSERTDPTRHYIGRFISGLRRALYRTAAAVVVQTATVAEWAESVVPQTRIHIIPNPVFAYADDDRRDGSHRSVLAVGRLVPVKGFDLLIAAFARCASRYPEWSLTIVGEGEQRPRLMELARQYGIAESVHMPGRRDVVEVMGASDIFVLSSRYEGFPNALLEAMASGLPVISFDCPSGPRHIIRDGVDGLLVPPNDVEALHCALERLMKSPSDRAALGDRARDVRRRFGTETVMQQWTELLELVTEEAADVAA